MTKKQIALVPGDGAAPEMMAVAARIAARAALMDGIEIEWVEAPMGWAAFEMNGDTTPKESLEKAVKAGIVFFGGVGDPKLDDTIGAKFKEMRPETRALLKLRQELGLLINLRPMVLMPELKHMCALRPERIPADGVKMLCVRFLLEDSYYGTPDLMPNIAPEVRKMLGIKLKKHVTGTENMITELAYYKRESIESYFRFVFRYAETMGLPVITIGKSNVMPRYVLWQQVAEGIAKQFPAVRHSYLHVDAANALMFQPERLQGVIACGNEHGDIISDGLAGMVGGLGMMHSASINPTNGAAMFESGAGTAPTLAGQDKANPIGRILTGALMLRHIGADKAAEAVERAVWYVLSVGFRTADIRESEQKTLVSCSKMGELVHDHIELIANGKA